ncbi:TPA: filamentous hemagglutinin N-terminal domain-containing protein [Burkholderia aenigmatica]|uniref:two-partner secretion domain-containing protein n=1 Tax=Burkholderia sp. AU45251 TaxID=3059204 RepID=UPI002655C3A6|nr:filamentous hemagglutinin N-terminal domain-containing protein [Burkholderia sp. AU45251]HDR9486673.1 filamentous hemagglutinin N-terminal domain-containing protein [Burkholderia aenigmatica]MDN7518538.1 filamentous hemagglutinin N-terminal domain-containing protein [Burkholderia sp. AU45251]HDR9518226.1 filamentous hemagglutinin N-terminal domain-containing protein [Burkholderia aenigmatica]HDR9595093.1 filamentous hemagglutinin N-terminal domain-containing protein [Burkholderia aenigmatica
MKTTRKRAVRRDVPLTPKRLAQLLAVALPALSAPAVQAQISIPGADNPHAPGIAIKNGNIIVQIVKPNDAGVSHNQFLDYNVGPKGLILNNGVTTSNTQLAGQIGGNERLGGQAAKVILNEVIGGGRTKLTGPTEIAGSSAQLIIANPNGITADGASFINASQVKLVAGAPGFDANGNANSFDTNGEIAIEGSGLDARGVARTDLIARTLRVNAKLQARQLVATAIDGNVKTDGDKLTYTLAQGTSRPEIAIDVSQLGSIHANAITLIGKGSSVGVNVAGRIEAIAGDPVVPKTRGLVSGGGITIMGSTGIVKDGGADGDVRLVGDATIDGTVAGSAVTMLGDAKIGKGGVVTASDKLLVVGPNSAGTALANDGFVRAGEVRVVGSTRNSGTLRGDRSVSLTGNAFVNEAGGLVSSGGAVDIVDGTYRNDGKIEQNAQFPDGGNSGGGNSGGGNSEGGNSEGGNSGGGNSGGGNAGGGNPEPSVPGLVADTNHANQPGVDVKNGVPVVDISKPNGSGVSHNRFMDYNVGPEGLILNNSTKIVDTELAGWIDGNARLGGKTARVILNEVTGSGKSQLKGATEIAGESAQLIIANPNGITANGARFINASQVKLVAGTPSLDANGNASRFDTKGDIVVAGDGLDASEAGRLDLVARSLRVDAALRALKLAAIAGDGTVTYNGDNSAFRLAQSPNRPEVAIDVSKRGSIDAHDITLTGNGSDTGVNIDGAIRATRAAGAGLDGNVTIAGGSRIGGTVDGESVQLLGGAEVGRDASVTARDALSVLGGLKSGGTVTAASVSVNGGTVNTGRLTAYGRFATNGGLRNDGTLTTAFASVNGGASNTGTLSVEGRLGINGGLTNGGTIEAETINVNGETTNTKRLFASDALILNGKTTNTGHLVTDGTLSINGGLENDLEVRAKSVSVNGGATNTGALTALDRLAVNGGLTNEGTVEAESISVNGGATNRGSLTADTRLAINGGLRNDAAVHAETISVNGGVFNAGTLRGDDRIGINGGIDNRAGARVSSGGVVKVNGWVDNAGEIEQYVKR